MKYIEATGFGKTPIVFSYPVPSEGDIEALIQGDSAQRVLPQKGLHVENVYFSQGISGSVEHVFL